MMELEPTRSHLVAAWGNGNPASEMPGHVRLTLGVGDQKGMLTACHTENPSHSWGDRFGDGLGSEDPQDIYPDLLWRLLKLHLGQHGVPLVLDIEAGEQVWNFPVYHYEVHYRPVDGNGLYRADMTRSRCLRMEKTGTKSTINRELQRTPAPPAGRETDCSDFARNAAMVPHSSG